VRRDDAGASAVELALVLSLLLTIGALVAPLAVAFRDRLDLASAAGDTIRFATSRPETSRQVGATTVQAGRIPSDAAVEAEAVRAYTGHASLGAVTTTTTADSTCPTGRLRRVTLTATAELGPFLGLMTGTTSRTLVAQATSCEE
jgi:Flp pilus assembly protein TadG